VIEIRELLTSPFAETRAKRQEGGVGPRCRVSGNQSRRFSTRARRVTKEEQVAVAQGERGGGVDTGAGG
jgi:hypothetical protein